MNKQRLGLAVLGLAAGVFLAYMHHREASPPRQSPSTATTQPKALGPRPSGSGGQSAPAAADLATDATPPSTPRVYIAPGPSEVEPPPDGPADATSPRRPQEAGPLDEADRLWQGQFDLAPLDSTDVRLSLNLSPPAAPTKPLDDAAPTLDFSKAMGVGLKGQLLEKQNTVVRGRLGGALSQEYDHLGEGQRIPEMHFEFQFERQLTKRSKILGEMEFGQDVTEFGRHRVRTQAAWEVALDDDRNVSLRTGVQEQSRKSPSAEASKNLNYTLDLIWKF